MDNIFSHLVFAHLLTLTYVIYTLTGYWLCILISLRIISFLKNTLSQLVT